MFFDVIVGRSKKLNASLKPIWLFYLDLFCNLLHYLTLAYSLMLGKEFFKFLVPEHLLVAMFLIFKSTKK